MAIIKNLLKTSQPGEYDSRKMKTASLFFQSGASYINSISYRRGFEDLQVDVVKISTRMNQLVKVIEDYIETEKTIKIVRDKYRYDLSPGLNLPNPTHYQAMCTECHRIGLGKDALEAKSKLEHAEFCHYEERIRDSPYKEKVYYLILKPEDPSKYSRRTKFKGA